MINDGSVQDATWPMPTFYFKVDLGDGLDNVTFQEVSGLDSESQTIEYRNANTSTFSEIKMPGLSKVGNVTMKRGIFINDTTFWDWHAKIKMNTIKRRTVLIKLIDESGQTTMQWQLKNAWPTKVTSTDLKSDGNEVAIDTLEIAYEDLTIQNP